MKTKFSAFIAVIVFFLLGATTISAQGTKVNFKKNGVTVFQSAISDIDSIVFKETNDEPVGDWVLINGVKWATRNVGAQNPEDYGNYYQWNKGTTDFLLYGDYYNSVYCNSTTWLPANDPSPAGYRVPTMAEIESLRNTTYVTYEWTTRNGVNGGKFTDKANGNSIFLPAAGCRYDYDGTLYSVGSLGFYWSSTQNETYDTLAYYLAFLSDSLYWANWDNKSIGYSVRPVAK